MSAGPTYHAVLEPGPSAVGATRRAVAKLLDGSDEEVVDRVLLCTSELVTNAIEHGGPPVEVHASVGPASVLVEVSDGSDRMPRLQHPGPDSTRGRGLLIVERCADRWGVHNGAATKTVWCEVSRTSGRSSS